MQLCHVHVITSDEKPLTHDAVKDDIDDTQQHQPLAVASVPGVSNTYHLTSNISDARRLVSATRLTGWIAPGGTSQCLVSS